MALSLGSFQSDDSELDELKQNYIALQKGTGEPWESIARRVEAQNDPHTAAWLRSRAAGAGEIAEETAPKGRTAGKGSIAAAEAAETASETPEAPAEGAETAEA